MVRERADRNGGSSPASSSTSLNVAELRQLISLMENSDLEEITIEHKGDGLRVTLRKPTPVMLDPSAALAVGDMLDVAAETAAAVIPEAATNPAEDVTPALDVRSSLVGFYRAVARRGAKPLAAGDTVKEGQVIGAVEALNVLNEIESPATGRVRQVLVGDGQPVEYGQVLLMVEPREG